jgi:hypothetical protein
MTEVLQPPQFQFCVHMESQFYGLACLVGPFSSLSFYHLIYIVTSCSLPVANAPILLSNQIDHCSTAARDNICTAMPPGTVEEFYNGVVKQGSSIVSSCNREVASRRAFHNLNYSHVSVSCLTHRVQNSAESSGTENWRAD